MAKLEYWESNRNMLLFLVKFKTLHNNVTDFSNEWKQEVKCTESFVTIFNNIWKRGWNVVLIIGLISLLLKVVLFLTGHRQAQYFSVVLVHALCVQHVL